MAGSQEAFVTLATNDTYAVGALVLANSLRNVGTSRQIAILITQGVTQGMREILSGTFDLVWVVDLLDSQDRTNLQLLARQDLGVTFTKLHCWRLTQYTKCVFMDADTLVMQNIDDLFEREEFSAAPDPGWPDCFNSGVFVFRPSDETFQNLMEFAMTHGTFDGGDQGLLNLFFSDWATKDISRHLPFVYNCVSMAFYSYLPAFKQFGKNVKVAHFIGASKPWHYAFNPSTGQVEDVDASGGHAQEFLQMWWRIFVERVKASLEGGMMMPFHIVPSKAFCSDPPTEVAPYCPPDIPVYYAPTIPSANHDPVHIEYRDCYNYLETFYVEPPMANIELYPNPGHQAYGTKEFESLCKEYFSTPSEEQSVSDAEKKTPYSNADVSVHHQPSEEPVRCPNEEQIVDHVPPEESVQCDQHDLEPVHQCCEESIFPNDEEKQINVSQEPALSQPIEVNHTVNTPQNVLTSKNEQQSESQQGAQTSSERELHQYQNGSIESDVSGNPIALHVHGVRIYSNHFNESTTQILDINPNKSNYPCESGFVSPEDFTISEDGEWCHSCYFCHSLSTMVHSNRSIPSDDTSCGNEVIGTDQSGIIQKCSWLSIDSFETGASQRYQFP